VKVRTRYESFRLGRPPRRNLGSIGGFNMRKEYDFSHSVKNPYTKKLKKPISIRIDPDTIEYFKRLAEETGIPYQNLMNHYLADCASKGLKPSLVWQKKGA
jgi:predicted DNA binding CopG/RHH family protein